MVQSRSSKTHNFTEVLDALEAIDAFPFGKSLSGELDEPAKTASQISPERVSASKKWLLQILSSFTGRKPQQAAPDAYGNEPEPEDEPAENGIEQYSKLEQQNIAFELGLKGNLSGLNLKQIRRDFAKENHPDRCEEEFREEATRRMTIANMLLDEARRKQKLGLPWE